MSDRIGSKSKMTAEQYRCRAEALFQEWKDSFRGSEIPFISDGVTDPDQWFHASVRPLFLLKEAYGWDRDTDLVKEHILSDHDLNFFTWQRITNWTKGILEGLPYVPLSEELKKFGNPYLHQIAAVNLKKQSGKSISSDKEIMFCAQRDAARILQQIELCDPTVIICGGTAKAFLEILNYKQNQPDNSDWFYHTELNGHDVIIIDYYHPANQFPNLLNYYALTEIYKHAIADQKKRLSGEDIEAEIAGKLGSAQPETARE